jgi:adenylate cyclase
MRAHRQPVGFKAVLIIGTASLLILLQLIGLSPTITTPIERVELTARDLVMRIRGVQEPSPDIVIVAIDDFSFQWTGLQFPWPRSYYAETIDQINKGGGKVVAMDIDLFEQDRNPANDEALAKALGESPASVGLVYLFTTTVDGYPTDTYTQPISTIRAVLDGSGITAVKRDEDAIVRSVQAFGVAYDDRVINHWAFEIARLYLDADKPTDHSQFSLQFNGQIVPLKAGDLTVNYSGPTGTYATYSIANVHDGITLEQDPDAFRDKIVLIGATTVTLQDIYPTPFSTKDAMPGVEIVANTIDTILHGSYIRETPPWLNLIITLAAALIAALISAIKRPTATLITMGIVMLGYLILGIVLFIRERLFIPAVAPEMMLFLGVVLPTLEHGVSQEMEKRRVRNLFSRFISPEMVDQMMSTQDLNSLNKRSDVSIIFSDIRGFTTLSEKMSPEDVVALLNPYLEAMSEVIYKHGGTVDKYEGDAIIAFFGEPVHYADHAARALRAALDMRIALDKLRKKWEKEGRATEIEMGIGINSGEVFVGLLGSAQRINYTVIGDNANLASRLQDLTKTYAWPILISESTYQSVKDEFDAEFADAVTVKGKTQPVNVYKVIGRKGAKKSEQLQSWQK